MSSRGGYEKVCDMAYIYKPHFKGRTREEADRVGKEMSDALSVAGLKRNPNLKVFRDGYNAQIAVHLAEEKVSQESAKKGKKP